MSSAIYIGMLLAVFWLCIWCAMPEAMRRRTWSPFDMKEDPADPRPAGSAPDASPAAPLTQAMGWRARAALRQAEGLAAGPGTPARPQAEPPQARGPARPRP